MEILLGFIFGAVIGIAVHFSVPHRDTRGVVIGPIVGALTSGAAWLALTWAGQGADTPWPWLASVLLPWVVTYPVLALLAARRTASDAREKARLGIS